MNVQKGTNVYEEGWICYLLSDFDKTNVYEEGWICYLASDFDK
jgi:hypothetical protein